MLCRAPGPSLGSWPPAPEEEDLEQEQGQEQELRLTPNLASCLHQVVHVCQFLESLEQVDGAATSTSKHRCK